MEGGVGWLLETVILRQAKRLEDLAVQFKINQLHINWKFEVNSITSLRYISSITLV